VLFWHLQALQSLEIGPFLVPYEYLVAWQGGYYCYNNFTSQLQVQGFLCYILIDHWDGDLLSGTATILLIEGKRTSQHLSFVDALRRRYRVILATTGKQAIHTLQNGASIDIIVFNAASMRTSGIRIGAALRRGSSGPIILIQHRDDKPGHYADRDADVVLYLPFTARKLTNRIERLIDTQDGETLVAGPFTLNVKSRTLTTMAGEIRLTPKMTTLMEQFMRRPDKIIEREFLMSKVWDTSYMGDTRTLDVHIRWIRQAIEKTPGKPRYLRTIRGKGYMLDIANNGRNKR
jgi:DNA-binding response OmpR family regulator